MNWHQLNALFLVGENLFGYWEDLIMIKAVYNHSLEASNSKAYKTNSIVGNLLLGLLGPELTQD